MEISFPFLDSMEFASGSEHGWALNGARLFKALGHNVHTGRSLLEQDFVADAMYIPERIDLGPDKTLWEQCQPKAKRFILGAYFPIPQWVRDVPNNAVIVSPWRSCGTHSRVLPYAYYKDYPQPNFSKKTLVWTTRNTFEYHGQALPHFDGDLYHLKACKQLVDEGYEFILFSADLYPVERDELPGRVKEALSIVDELRDNPKTTVANHVFYDEYIDLLKEASVAVPLSALGSTGEALKVGTYPLNWEPVGHLYESFPQRIKYPNLSYENIYETLRRLLSDEAFYNQEFNTLFSRAAVYSLDEALSLANSILNSVEQLDIRG